MQTAQLRKILPLLCPALSSLCLGLGYVQSGVWAAVVGILPLLIWIAARRWKVPWIANLGLAITTAAAAYGLTMGAPLVWMLPGAALGLASWDLSLLDASLDGSPPGVTERLEKGHYTSLGLALALSLLVVILGRMIRFQIPFIFMLALVVLAYLSLDRLLRSLKD